MLHFNTITIISLIDIIILHVKIIKLVVDINKSHFELDNQKSLVT